MIILLHEKEDRAATGRLFRGLAKAFPNAEHVIWKDGSIPSLKGEHVVCICNSIYHSSATFATLQSALLQCKRFAATCDDETFGIPTQVRQAIEDRDDNLLLSHLRGVLKVKGHLKSWAWASEMRYVNMNLLSWHPVPWGNPTEKGLFYYGMCRDPRAERFKRYFVTSRYPVTISTSPKNVEKWMGVLGERDSITYYPKLTWQQMQSFPMTVYLHDEPTGVEVSPANRFYECLSVGIAQVFDAGTQECFMRELGINVGKYVVSNAKDVRKMLPHWKSIRAKQFKEWARPFHAGFNRQARKALKEMV